MERKCGIRRKLLKSYFPSASQTKSTVLSTEEGPLLVTELTGHTDNAWGVAFSPDGYLIATASNDGIVGIWRVSDGKLLKNNRAQLRQKNYFCSHSFFD